MISISAIAFLLTDDGWDHPDRILGKNVAIASRSMVKFFHEATVAGSAHSGDPALPPVINPPCRDRHRDPLCLRLTK